MEPAQARRRPGRPGVVRSALYPPVPALVDATPRPLSRDGVRRHPSPPQHSTDSRVDTRTRGASGGGAEDRSGGDPGGRGSASVLDGRRGGQPVVEIPVRRFTHVLSGRRRRRRGWRRATGVGASVRARALAVTALQEAPAGSPERPAGIGAQEPPATEEEQRQVAPVRLVPPPSTVEVARPPAAETPASGAPSAEVPRRPVAARRVADHSVTAPAEGTRTQGSSKKTLTR